MNDYQNTNYGDIFRSYNHYPSSFQARPNRQRPILGRENLPRIIFWCALISIAAMLLSGCGATVTINVLSSHSRYGQAIGGTNNVIKGQIEGGGGNSNQAALTP